MRIIVTADLHYEAANRQLYVDFAHWIADQRPDCFILAGDLGHPLRLFQRCLQLFEDLACPKLVLAGNHDVYAGEHSSRLLWEHELKRVARAEGFVWLEQQPMRLGAIGVCGTMGWYDYSSAASHLSLEHHEYRSLKPLVNHDADYVNWPWSDRAMARYLAKSFSGRLQTLHADPSVEQILVVTHMPIFKQAIPDYPESDYWTLLQPYLGNITLGNMVEKHAKVSHVISGHIHRPGRWAVDTDHGKIDFRVVGSKRGGLRAVTLEL
jgi:3',5'-cyclic AMP phosphodiesterase CpdA